MNQAKLEFSGNNVTSGEAEIVSTGTITSKINITVLENKTHQVNVLTVKLNATVTDDNGNLINDINFNFTIDGKTNITAVYNSDKHQYEAEYNLTKAGIYNVSVTYPVTDNLILYNGTINCTKGTFSDLNDKIDKANGELNLTYNFTYTPEIDGAYVNGM